MPAILLSQQVFKLKSLFYAQLDLQKLSYKVSPVLYELQDTGVIALMRRKFNILQASDPWLEINNSLPTIVLQHGAQGQYLMPSHLMGYHNKNQTLVNIKTLSDNATLAEAYQLLLNSGEETAIIHKKLGHVFLATGDHKQAKFEFEKALSIAPDDEEIKNALQDLR